MAMNISDRQLSYKIVGLEGCLEMISLHRRKVGSFYLRT